MIYYCCDESRRQAVKDHDTLNGIDFLEVLDDPTQPTDERQRTLFLRLLLEVVLAGSRLRTRERTLIWTVCTELDIGRVELAQLEAMIRAQKGFKRSPAGDADAARLRQAYATLGLEPEASNDDIKKAYRRLMNRSHPDKIAGSNPDAEAVADAERRTREVRGAYEMLKARRSIR